MKTNFRDTVTYITRFLGLKFEGKDSQEERQYLTVKAIKLEADKLGFQINYRGETQVFLPEQVVAAFLTKLLNILEINKISKDQPIVISVPSYATVQERQALLDSATISSMKVIRLLNESTAVALDYGSSRRG